MYITLHNFRYSSGIKFEISRTFHVKYETTLLNILFLYEFYSQETTLFGLYVKFIIFPN